jgi:hypothetical protein
VRTPIAAEQLAETADGAGRAAVVGVGPAGTQVAVAVLETVPPARTDGPAPQELAQAVRSVVRNGADLELAAVLAVRDLPTDIRHNSKIDRSALAGWASKVLGGGKAGRP